MKISILKKVLAFFFFNLQVAFCVQSHSGNPSASSKAGLELGEDEEASRTRQGVQNCLAEEAYGEQSRTAYTQHYRCENDRNFMNFRKEFY